MDDRASLVSARELDNLVALLKKIFLETKRLHPEKTISPSISKSIDTLDIDAYFGDTEFLVHPALAAALNSTEPPTIEFWYQLPAAVDTDNNVWLMHPTFLANFVAVYAAVIGKKNGDIHVYMGSGCAAKEGVRMRLRQWKTIYRPSLSQQILDRLDSGDHILHHGIMMMIKPW